MSAIASAQHAPAAADKASLTAWVAVMASMIDRKSVV